MDIEKDERDRFNRLYDAYLAPATMVDREKLWLLIKIFLRDTPDTKRLDVIEGKQFDLRYFDANQRGGDDTDSYWSVVNPYALESTEYVVGHGKTARAAVDSMMFDSNVRLD